MIYLILRGRVGNQLFMYAAARRMQLELDNEKIIIDDADVRESKWENLLPFYDLPNVEYVHTHSYLTDNKWKWQRHCMTFFQSFIFPKSYMEKYRLEKKYSKIFQLFGYYECENGYLPYNGNKKINILMDGYFQSEKYFSGYNKLIKKEFDLTDKINTCGGYDTLIKFAGREVVCISAKVQHNVGSSMYDVCTKEYWKKAVEYILTIVKNPLFFICSDNVAYVKENFFCTDKYDMVEQPRNIPTHISLALMSMAKYFVIGNTTFAWWAQYLCNDENKVVIAPSKWMNIDMPIDIYQENWKLIDV